MNDLTESDRRKIVAHATHEATTSVVAFIVLAVVIVFVVFVMSAQMIAAPTGHGWRLILRAGQPVMLTGLVWFTRKHYTDWRFHRWVMQLHAAGASRHLEREGEL